MITQENIVFAKGKFEHNFATIQILTLFLDCKVSCFKNVDENNC
jgi:hypothetical protein